MRLLTLSALSLSATTTLAYLNTSPFFLFSTSKHFESFTRPSIQSSSKISQEILSDLSSCPTKNYIIVSQHGVSTSDYHESTNIPILSSKMSMTPSEVHSSFAASEVIGNIETQRWREAIVQKCKASSIKIDGIEGTIPSISSSNLIEITFPAPSETSRLADMKKNDAYLASVIDMLDAQDYTVLYTTTAKSASPSMPAAGELNTQYQMEQPLFDIPHAELKRDVASHKRQTDDDDVTFIDGPLFDRYQFFTPGVWMGFSAALLLVGILYVGISALAGLKVTYAAFEKENGPQASRKAQ